MSKSRPRILLYSHDTYGLGHLRRTLAIAWQLGRDMPRVDQLLLTGSMVAGAFSLPMHLDLIKLPGLSKHTDGRYKARALPLSLSETIAWREQMILHAAQVFEPDLILVDKAAAGVQGEVLPTLRYLKAWRPQTRLVFGMRDIEDAPDVTRAEWEQTDTRWLHEEIYDCILLYGERRVFDPVREYAMSSTAAAKLVPCGYLANATPSRTRETVRRELDAGDNPLIVVTAGGGGDGFQLLKTYLDAVSSSKTLREAHSLIVTGPLMAQSKRELLQSAARAEHVSLIQFTSDLVSYLAAADLVVGMAGYNTVSETLALGARTLLVPRVRPRQEQRIRAQRLAALKMARVLLPDDLSPQRLADEIESALNTPAPKVSLDMNGASHASRALLALLKISTPDKHAPRKELAKLEFTR